MARPVNAAAMGIADTSEGCVLHAYQDSTGVWTAGWGHVGADVKPGIVITQAQADTWRAQDMARAAAFVEAHVTVPLTDNQFSVLAEWTFNVGVGNFLGSTLLRVLNKGRYDAVPAQLKRWVRAGGMPLPGLVTRRAKEAVLWDTPDGSPAPALSAPEAAANLLRVCTGDQVAKPSAPTFLERFLAWIHRDPAQPN